MTISAHVEASRRPGNAPPQKRKGSVRDFLSQFAPGMTAALPPAGGGEDVD